jgi:hypothetical protein
MESRGDAYIIIEEVKSNHNICNKAGFTIWLCKYFGPKINIILNCLIVRQRCLRKISSMMYKLERRYTKNDANN